MKLLYSVTVLKLCLLSEDSLSLDVYLNQLEWCVLIAGVLVTADSYLDGSDGGKWERDIEPRARERRAAGGAFGAGRVAFPERVISEECISPVFISRISIVTEGVVPDELQPLSVVQMSLVAAVPWVGRSLE